MSSQSNNSADSGHLDNRGKSFSKINALPLSVTTDNQTSFIPFHRTISLEFDPINPFTANGFLTRGKIYLCPCVISMQSLYFRLHSLYPKGIKRSLVIGMRFMKGKESLTVSRRSGRKSVWVNKSTKRADGRNKKRIRCDSSRANIIVQMRGFLVRPGSPP